MDELDTQLEVDTQLWVLAAIGRLAAAGLTDTPIPADDDPVAAATQRLLLEAGWLTDAPFGLSAMARSTIPPGAPTSSAAGYVRELLACATRYVDGAAPGWAESDPGLIRWRGAASAAIVGHILDSCYPHLPGFPDRLAAPGAAFLDVGTGAGCIAINLCRDFPTLRAVGLDVSQPAIKVAREDVDGVGLGDRLEIREESVGELSDISAFDLLWLPQPFIAPDVLSTALPRLFAAARPGAALVMVVAANRHSGLVGAATELRNLMTGGATMQLDTAAELVARCGFERVRPISGPAGDLLTAMRA